MNNLPRVDPIDKEYMQKAHDHILTLTMPTWALGDLLDLSKKLCGISRTLNPSYVRKKIFIFASDHGVTEEGVSLFPKEVTAQMVYNFVNGGAAINVLARHANASTVVVDMGVDADLSFLSQDFKIADKKISRGTKNMAVTEAMSRSEAEASIQAGIDIVFDTEMNTDLYAVGEMGIGNTTASSAMIAAFLGLSPEEVTGRGTGLDDNGLLKKISVIEKIFKLHSLNPKDPIDILQKVGGFEIGAMAGMIIGAAHFKRPVLIDGLISSTAALLAGRLEPNVIDYMIFSHSSVEKAHKHICLALEQKPLLDLNMRLGEGSGTPLAMNLIDASLKILSEMATFTSANISKSEE